MLPIKALEHGLCWLIYAFIIGGGRTLKRYLRRVYGFEDCLIVSLLII